MATTSRKRKTVKSSSEEVNRGSHEKDRHSRESYSREGLNRESLNRDGYPENRLSGEALSRESYSRERINRKSTENRETAPTSKEAETGNTEESIAASQEDSSLESERIEVLITSEFREYVEKVTIGKLSRNSFASSLKLNKFGYYCALVAYVSTMDSFTLFTFSVEWRSEKINKKEAYNAMFAVLFLGPFVLCMFVIGFPMVYLELALGQYTHTTVLTIFDRIAPITVGVGASALLILILNVMIGNDLLHIMYGILFQSMNLFITELPWDNCLAEHSKSRRFYITHMK
ncbi:hypothetical protein DICVIV_00592 [Dictyocaulus viviparus]|uniref:Uncharacterized protein n=1 Tax=Dictyocaulus viviparus TaxID=29172 RepID=A0A0D8YF66_DICVI|nr:hypothetical protein DICVIV_00592 [Dictyocaulus viviparus]